MAQIPRAALDYLTKEINGISADAKAKVMRVLDRLDWNDVPACRDAVVTAVNAVLDAYSLAAGQASADFFDASREIAVGSRLGAAVATGRDPDATEGAIRAFVEKVLKGDIDSFNSAVISRVGYELKRSAGQTMMENDARDPLKPRFARVPSGGETCKFCLMLASRGFVYHSKKTAGEFGHYHDNCDCRIVASWDKDGVEGYDPTAYHNEWLGRENFTIPEAKLTGYAFNMNHAKGKDKAIAFREALGFTSDDAPEIMRQVYRWVGAHEPIYSHTDQFGDRLTTDMMMTGKNGKTAKVTVGWIKEPGADKMRMTSIYVSKRKR